MTNEIQKRDERPDPFRNLLTRAIEKGAGAIPAHLGRERVLTVVMVEAGRNPKLRECTAQSVVMCVMHAAQLGLEPGGPMGQAYLIPRRNKGKMECTVIIGYKGLAALCRRSGEIKWMDANVVYDGDVFEWELGLNRRLRHEPKAAPEDRTPDNVTHAYAIVVTKDGGEYFIVLDKGDIEARHDRSGTKGKSFSPWRSDYAAMARKSALRALLNGGLVPMSAELATAVGYEVDDEVRRGETEGEIVDDTPALTGDGLDAFGIMGESNPDWEWSDENAPAPADGGAA